MLYEELHADPYTGLANTLNCDLAGDKYENCFIYFKPGVVFAYGSCRVDPPPEHEKRMWCTCIVSMDSYIL